MDEKKQCAEKVNVLFCRIAASFLHKLTCFLGVRANMIEENQ